jgi:hypothetical protein
VSAASEDCAISRSRTRSIIIVCAFISVFDALKLCVHELPRKKTAAKTVQKVAHKCTTKKKRKKHTRKFVKFGRPQRLQARGPNTRSAARGFEIKSFNYCGETRNKCPETKFARRAFGGSGTWILM